MAYSLGCSLFLLFSPNAGIGTQDDFLRFAQMRVSDSTKKKTARRRSMWHALFPRAGGSVKDLVSQFYRGSVTKIP